MIKNKDKEVRICIKPDKYKEIKEEARLIGLKPSAFIRMILYKNLGVLNDSR